MSEFVAHLADVVGQHVGYLLIFTESRDGVYNSQGDYAYEIASRRILKLNPARVEVSKGSAVIPQLPFNTTTGVGVIFQSVSGKLKPLGRKQSRRCAQCLLKSAQDLNLFLLESDACASLDATFGPDTWQRIYGSLPFGVVSVVFSGDRGDHVLSLSNQTLQKNLPKLKNLLALLGADPGAFSSTQITRVGGGQRIIPKNKEQSWLYRSDGRKLLPSVAQAKTPFVSIQDFINRVSALVEEHRNDLQEDIARCDAECAKLIPAKASATATTVRPVNAPKSVARPAPKGKRLQRGKAFVGKVADDPSLIGRGSNKQAARQAAFKLAFEIRGAAVKTKEIPFNGTATPELITRAALVTGFTEDYIEYIYANNSMKASKRGVDADDWFDYRGVPFGAWAKPAEGDYIAPIDGPTRFLPHHEHWGAPGSEKQLLNELGHSCMALQVKAKLTREEETTFLVEFWKLRQRQKDFPFDNAIATALGIGLDFTMTGKCIIPNEVGWSTSSTNQQIRKAATIRQLHRSHTLVPLYEPLHQLLSKLRGGYKTEKDFIRALKKDIKKRREKWPTGVPTASLKRYMPLYGALLTTWKNTKKTIFSKSEVYKIGQDKGFINSQPGTKLRRKVRVKVKDLDQAEFERLKPVAEARMVGRCMDMLNVLGLVKLRKHSLSHQKRRGAPESRWKLQKPKTNFRRFSQKSAKSWFVFS